MPCNITLVPLLCKHKLTCFTVCVGNAAQHSIACSPATIDQNRSAG